MTQNQDQQGPLTPNQYELTGQQTQITYARLGEQALLTYQVFQGPPTRSFQGDQIRTQDTEIGTLISVTLEVIPDASETSLTVVVPQINLSETREQSFETVALLTTQRSSIAGPDLVVGVVQSYRIVPLEGIARLVTT